MACLVITLLSGTLPTTAIFVWSLRRQCWLGMKMLRNVLWSDKAIFHICGLVNCHNCHYSTDDDPCTIYENFQNQPQMYGVE